MSDMTSLLDGTLDDIDDLPEFKPFPAGAHRCRATFSLKDGIPNHEGSHPELELTLIETLEFADPQAGEPENNPPKAGDKCSSLFFLDNEFGAGMFKKMAKPFGAALGLNSNRDIVEQVTDIEVIVITSLKEDKKDPDKKYLNIKEIEVVS